MLDPLVQAIQNAQAMIQRHGAYIGQREDRTRLVLIDPILRALGWNTGDPDIIQTEYAIGTGRADYVLLVGDKPAIIIEAKRLGAYAIDRDTEQALNYANIAAIEHLLITDGNQWTMMPTFERTPLDKRERTLDFSVDDPHVASTALKALTLWRPNIRGTPTIVNASQPIGTKTQRTPEPKIRRVKQPAGDPPTVLDTDCWHPIETFAMRPSTPRGKPIQRPCQIRMEHRSAQVSTSGQVLAQIVGWLIDDRKIAMESLPLTRADISPTSRSVKPCISRKRKDLLRAIETRKGVWVEINMNYRDIARHIMELRERFCPHAAIEIQVSPPA